MPPPVEEPPIAFGPAPLEPPVALVPALEPPVALVPALEPPVAPAPGVAPLPESAPLPAAPPTESTSPVSKVHAAPIALTEKASTIARLCDGERRALGRFMKISSEERTSTRVASGSADDAVELCLAQSHPDSPSVSRRIAWTAWTSPPDIFIMCMSRWPVV
jgi:hypothetical protein